MVVVCGVMPLGEGRVGVSIREMVSKEDDDMVPHSLVEPINLKQAAMMSFLLSTTSCCQESQPVSVFRDWLTCIQFKVFTY